MMKDTERAMRRTLEVLTTLLKKRERERGNDVRHRASHEADLGGVDNPSEEGLAGVAAHPSVVEVGNGHIPAHWAICK